MARFSMIVAIAALSLLTGSCRRDAAPADNTVHLKPTTDDSAEKTAAGQNRIAATFHDSIVPKIRTCWSNLKGEGEVLFNYTYRRDGNNWVFQNVAVNRSSLDKGQDAAALRCMQEAVPGSSIPLQPDEAARDSKELVLHWGWPVPFPSDTTQLARMATSSEGESCIKLCKDCKPNQERRSVCVSSCSGFSGCVEDGTGTGCRMSRPECKTGWSGSWVGGLFIAREEDAFPSSARFSQPMR